MARMATASVALAAVTALAVAAVAQRAAVAASFAVLGHLHWLCIPAALLLEFASMAAFAIMLRRLLAAGGASVGIRPMLATATRPTRCRSRFRWPGRPWPRPSRSAASPGRARMPRWRAESLLVGGVISSAAAALIVVGGALVSGNTLVTAVTVLVGVLAVAVLVATVVAVLRWLRAALERAAGWMLRRHPHAAMPCRRSRADHQGVGRSDWFRCGFLHPAG